MSSTSDVVRVDVREALLRPDESVVAERNNTWYVRAPLTLSDGRDVPGHARVTFPGASAYRDGASADVLVLALIAIYQRGCAQAQQAAPHDPNFVAPQEIVLRRLTPEEAASRPYANAYCLELSPAGELGMRDAAFAPTTLEPPRPAEPPPAPAAAVYPEAPVAPAADASAAILAVLGAFGAGRATGDQVLRGLMEHPAWLAPAWLFADGRADVVVPKLVLFGEEARMPPGVCWLFTDRAHAEHANAQLVAQGGQLGPYVEGASGVEVFRRMAIQTFEKLNVNIGSPVEETFFVGDRPGELMALWANAIGLEHTLAASREPDDPQSLQAFRDFPGVCALTGPEGILTIERGGLAGLVAFTSVDCAKAYLETLAPAQREACGRITPSGEVLLQQAAAQTGGRLFLNPAGPGPKRTLQVG